jgi:hypothetical protein
MKMMNFNINTQIKKVIDTQMKNTQMKEVSATAKKRAFENSTLRQFSQFQRVLIETTTSDEMNTKTTLAVHRADSVSGRERERRERKKREEREKRKKREERERERREREQAYRNRLSINTKTDDAKSKDVLNRLHFMKLKS